MSRIPSLNALRTFHAVAGADSLSEAARELGVTPGAVSRQITNLEECVGVALLIRNGRNVQLTADGTALRNELEDAFRLIGSAVDRLQRPPRGERLRVVVPPIFAAAWLIPRLARFTEKRPQTDVILVESAERVAASSGAELVVGWGRYEDDATAFAERLSPAEDVFPVCSPQACAGEGLAGATLLHREKVVNCWRFPDWPTFLADAGLDSAGTVDGPSLTPGLMFDAVRRGAGVALVSTTTAHDDLAEGRLVRPVGESVRVENGFWLLTARAAYDRPEVAAFRGWLRNEFDTCFARRARLD